MNYIEERLCKITENNPEGRKYYKQWEIAKDYMPQILQSISQCFPHYSLHDQSHSESILNNIVRVLGRDTIDRLSVVDLWLLLTAAYYHDTGMFISAEDKNTTLCSGSNFVKYLVKMQKEPLSPMHNFATMFEIRDNTIYYKDGQVTAQNMDALRFLLADYFRSHHAERSAEKINNANSLNLPGNPIPTRITKILGNICRAHTQKLQDVLRLPKEESSGIGTEDCHPRYIACLLRIGDLLDIDTNRVSEVLLSTLPTIPADSEKYLGTNRDMTHIRIDQLVIEMTASCKDYDVANMVDNWFRMIESEVSFQIKNWYLIVPDTTFGSLPTTGNMIVNLEGYENFNLDEKPRFKIDDDIAIEILQGAGLYNSPSQCIRELLQNAVDATYLRVFKENPKIKTIKEFQDYCAEERYQIQVEVKRKNVQNGFVFWGVTITDNGIGMAKDELKCLFRTGSSRKNETKQKIIDAMPEWMRPSGTFGIGFQSVFLMTDIVIMETRSWRREETLRLTLYNPTGKERGNILLQTSKDEDNPYGTTISFEIKKALPELKYGEKECSDIYVNRDDLYNATIDDVISEIMQFSKFSYINIRLNIQEVIRDLKPDDSNSFKFYDYETGLQIRLGGSNLILFKNQPVADYGITLPILGFHINILSGDANNILTLNRNAIRSEYKEELRKNILYSSYKYIIQEFDNLSEDGQTNLYGNSQKHIAASYLELLKERIFPQQTVDESKLQENWKELLLYDEEKKEKHSINELLYSEIIDYIEIKHNMNNIFFYDENGLFFQSTIGSLSRFLLSMAYTKFKGIQYTADGILIQKKPISEYIKEDDQTRQIWIRNYRIMENSVSTSDSRRLTFMYPNRRLYSRENMPCNDKYKVLEIKNDWYEPTFLGFNFRYPIMVCPFIHKPNEQIKYVVDENLIDYVYTHRMDKNVTKEQIVETYKQFYNDYEKAYQKEISEG